MIGKSQLNNLIVKGGLLQEAWNACDLDVGRLVP